MRGLATVALLCWTATAWPADDSPGSLVVEVQAKTAAAIAGIEPGTVVVAWRQVSSSGESASADWQPVRSPLDLMLVEQMLASNREIEIQFQGDSELQSKRLLPRELGIVAQTPLINGLSVYQELGSLQGKEKLQQMEALEATEAGSTVGKYWLQTEVGIAALNSKEIETAHRWFEAAVATLEGTPDKSCFDRPQLLLRVGEALWQSGEYAAADESLASSLAAAALCGDADIVTAHVENLRGRVAAYAGNFENAHRYSSQALETQVAISPESLAVAETLHTLGNTAFWQGDTDLAEQRYSESLEIRASVSEGSVGHGRSLATLGNVAWRRGELDVAEDYFLKAHAIHAIAVPNSLLVAGDLTMLGHVAYDRRDFRRAEEYYFRSLEITEAFFPGEETVANTLMGLGNAARRQYDLEAARDYHTRAMNIYEQLDAKQRLTLVYSNLANVEFDAGQLDVAEVLYRRSLDLRIELGTSESFMAPLRYSMANVARRRGDIAEGRRQLLDVLETYRSSAPDSLQVQSTTFTLGELELAENNAEAAVVWFQEALEIAENLAPGTLYEVEPLHRLGKLAALHGETSDALNYFRRAVDAFETQRLLVGGNVETRANFAAKFDYLYKDLAELLIDQDEPEAAFDIVERYRSRLLMAMMLGRAQDVQRPVVAELADDWSQVHRNYDAALNDLMRAKSVGPKAIAELRLHLDTVRNERDAFVSRYRALDPARAAFEYPATNPLAAIIDELPTNSTLLSYLVGNHAVYAFVVKAGDPQALQLFKLDTTREQLESDTALFGELLRLRNPNPTLESSQRQVAARLYRNLIQPVNSALEDDRKLVILADGVLHSLPFSALVTNEADSDVPRYLIEERAIHYAPSLDWLLATRDRKLVQRDSAVAVFADPVVAANDAGSYARNGQGAPFTPLPGARDEAESIAAMFKSTQIFLGESATESNAKRIANSELAILHFATHGVIDSVRPMESFLLLGRGDDDSSVENGLLQASEVAEQMNLSNALVVLSACDTSVGKLSAGEGVIGLGSAFLYAGARHVVSTLWAVSDTSTSRLMSNFYEHLGNGESPADALRVAQLAEIERARKSNGFITSWRRGWQRFRGETDGPSQHWAAFRLYGEFN